MDILMVIYDFDSWSICFRVFWFQGKELRKNEKRVLTIGLSLLIVSGHASYCKSGSREPR